MHILDYSQMLKLLKTFNREGMFVLHEHEGGSYFNIECFVPHRKKELFLKLRKNIRKCIEGGEKNT